jgi:hypothetical protein
MDWQQVASLVVVALTAFLLVRAEIAKRQRAKLRACGHDCGCSSDALDKLKQQSILQTSNKP